MVYNITIPLLKIMASTFTRLLEWWANWIILPGISFVDMKGTIESSANDYYVLCGSGSCSDFTFSGNDITGGPTSCDYPTNSYP